MPLEVDPWSVKNTTADAGWRGGADCFKEVKMSIPRSCLNVVWETETT